MKIFTAKARQDYPNDNINKESICAFVYREEIKSFKDLPCFAERGLFVSVDVRLSTISEIFNF